VVRRVSHYRLRRGARLFVQGLTRRIDGWRLKLYGIAYRSDRPVQALVDAAVAAAQERLPRPAVSDDRYGVGFVGAHDGRGANFVFVDWWANEDGCTTTRGSPARRSPAGFGPSARTTSPRAPGTWPYSDTSAAWVRHVLARAQGPDLDAYLADRLSAEI
jgi:hypothetical protein